MWEDGKVTKDTTTEEIYDLLGGKRKKNNETIMKKAFEIYQQNDESGKEHFDYEDAMIKAKEMVSGTFCRK